MMNALPSRLPVSVARRACGPRAGVALSAWLLAVTLMLSPAPGAAQLLAPPAATSTPAGAPAAAVPEIPTVATTGVQRVGTVAVELVSDVTRAAPGQPFRLGLRIEHDPHWHTYWRNPGDSGLPTRFDPVGPMGASFGEIVWPAPRRLAIGPLANFGYEGELLLAREAVLPAEFDESTVRFEVHAQWLVCREICIPGEARLAVDLPVGSPAQPAGGGLSGKFEDSARQAPDGKPRLQAGWWHQDERAYLLIPAGTRATRAEFFPYFEGLIRPAAPQSLLSAAPAPATGGSDGAGSLALMLEILPRVTTQSTAPGGLPSLPDAGGLPTPPAGLLLLDGNPVEVGLQRLAQAPAVGRVLATAEVEAAAPPVAGGLLERLRGGFSAATSAGGSSPAAGAAVARAFPSSALSGATSTLPLALLGALLGGLILNLMPCVFPVIGLKVLSFSQAGAGEVRRARGHAMSFALGVVLSFVALGAILLALRGAGEASGWGFQMQSPVFVGAMALLFVLIALNLSGVFETGLSLTRVTLPWRGARAGGPIADSPGSAPGLGSSFGTGVIAVLVATPCTAPFMGGAVGYTMSSPAPQTLMVFAALGIGMAAPYLLLGSFPQLLHWLPRPGPWLHVFKQLLAFPMLATAAWLAWVLTLQTGADGLLRLLMSAVLVAFAAWLYGRSQAAWFAGRSGPGWAGLTAALLAGLVTLWQLAQIGNSPVPAVPASGETASLGRAGTAGLGERTAGEDSGDATDSRTPAAWQDWSQQKVSQALAQGRPVLVDFTAAWCISCQANKKLVLDRQVVREALAADRVALLRADWTSRDPAITAELARFGRNGVPLYLMYHPGQALPLMLPELLTVDILLAALADRR